MIWSKLYIDILMLYAPGVLAIVLSHWIPSSEQSAALLVFSFVSAGVLDSGHVYATLWRTYFRPSERQRTSVYWLVPIVFFAVFYLWVHFQWKYLAAFVVYATVFHNVRQLLGISRWYQKLNKQWSKVSDIFLYSLCAVPFVAFHFRETPKLAAYYATDELFFYPNSSVYVVAIAFFTVVSFSWLGFEAYRLYRYGDFNRTLSVFFAALFYGCAFINGETAAQILFPLVVSHGFSYLALTDLSLRRIEPTLYKGFVPLAVVVLTAFIFGSAEYWVEDEWLDLSSNGQAFTTALLLTPLFCHYFFDSFLWKSTHPDARRIYA